MKYTLFVSGLLLLFLLPNWSLEEDVDINTLGRIFNFFEQNYKKVDRNGIARQYAVAINVPKEQCQPGFVPEQNNFLTQEMPEDVKNTISSTINPLYQGEELIAAGILITDKYTAHSEDLLLNPANNSPMSKLLRRRRNSCSVFYTFNSPCVNKCLNANSYHSIINALKKWKKHRGIKAFVFNEFWWRDLDRDIEEVMAKFRQIMNRIPLYRCLGVNECYACKGEGNTINPQCLPRTKNKH